MTGGARLLYKRGRLRMWSLGEHRKSHGQEQDSERQCQFHELCSQRARLHAVLRARECGWDGAHLDSSCSGDDARLLYGVDGGDVVYERCCGCGTRRSGDGAADLQEALEDLAIAPVLLDVVLDGEEINDDEGAGKERRDGQARQRPRGGCRDLCRPARRHRVASMTASPVIGMIGENHMCP